MKLIRLLLRLTVGAVFVVHGSQKLFGWFDGYGPDGTGQFFESLGLRPGRQNAIAAGTTEFGGGLLLASGVATPVAAAGLTAVTITALRTAIWKDGVKPATGELEFLLAVAALSVAEENAGPGWALAALAAGATGSQAAITAGRRQAAPPAGA